MTSTRGTIDGFDGIAATALKVLFIAVQGIIAWWATTINGEIKQLNEKVNEKNGRIMRLEGLEGVNQERLGRIEKKIDDIRDRLPVR